MWFPIHALTSTLLRLNISGRIHELDLTHWGWVTHICVSKLGITGSDNRLLLGQRQAIIWSNDRILLVWPWGTKFSEILINIHIFSFKKIYLKMSSAKYRLFCLSLKVLNWLLPNMHICIRVTTMACFLFSTKPLPEPMLTYQLIHNYKLFLVEFMTKYTNFHSRKFTSKCCP